MNIRLYDAHNHLQDERLRPFLQQIMAALESENVQGMVVNGSSEADWQAVLDLARRYPQVQPSFGYHPWYVKERSAHWQERLKSFVGQVPSAVGEIGLDRWIKDHDMPQQEEAFVWQLRLAAERNLPVSIHCLQAWGRLLDLLRANPRPRCGLILHSYGGAAEMVGPLAELGAYFSLPGYFAHERKVKQREAFRQVPRERLLIETDAPDQLPPSERIRYPLQDSSSGREINHPANLRAIYEFTADLLGQPVDALAAQVEENFQRLFGHLNQGADFQSA